MMGIVMPETCWAYKKRNKIINGSFWFFILQYTAIFWLLYDNASTWEGIRKTDNGVIDKDLEEKYRGVIWFA